MRHTLQCTAAVAAAVVVVVLGCTSTEVRAQDACDGSPNTIPVFDNDPVFVQSVANGKRFIVGNGTDTFDVVHLWGTPYEQGYAMGQLKETDIRNISTMLDAYLEMMAEQAVPWLPQWIVDLVVENGAPFILELTWNATEPFLPQKYKDELQGIADGAGVPVQVVRNLNMFPETTKAACTIVGANGAATPNGTLTHLRALDFPTDCPMKNYAQVTVYHGNPVTVNVGWSGMIGVLTGISNTSISIGEKVWYPSDPLNIEGIYGEPWMFVLRDALGSADMNAALQSIQRANRTCAIHVGIGDSTTNTFRGLTIAEKAFNVFNWSSLGNWTGHPIIEDVFYWDKFVQPSSNPCLGELLQSNYGQLTAQRVALQVAPVSATGGFHCVTFDLANSVAFIANARKDVAGAMGDINAYNRQFVRLDLNKLYAESAP